MKERIGIDLSLNSPAIYLPKQRMFVNFVNITGIDITKTKSKKYAGYQWLMENGDGISVIPFENHEKSKDKNYDVLAEQIAKTCGLLCCGVDDINIEGYSYNSKGSSAFELVALQTLLRVKLHDRGFNVHIVPPTTAKKNFTGKGNATKEEIIAEYIRRKAPMWKQIEECSKVAIKPVDDITDSYSISLVEV